MAPEEKSTKMTRRNAVRLLACAATASAILPRSIAFAASQAPETESTKGRAFSALAYRRISYDVHDYTKTRDFYTNLLGMKVAFEDANRCVLEFGEPVNALFLRNLKQPGDKARTHNFAFSIANYDSQEVGEELTRRGLAPRVDGKYAWAIHDPNGITLHISAEREEFSDQNFSGTLVQPAGMKKAPFKAIAVSHAVIRTDDVQKSRDFYVGLLGMKKIFENEKECFLSFGPSDNHLYIRKLESSETKPHIESFAITISNFKRAEVKSELIHRGLVPEADSPYGWTVTDPDGFSFGVVGKGLPEYVARACHGDAADCAK